MGCSNSKDQAKGPRNGQPAAATNGSSKPEPVPVKPAPAAEVKPKPAAPSPASPVVREEAPQPTQAAAPQPAQAATPAPPAAGHPCPTCSATTAAAPAVAAQPPINVASEDKASAAPVANDKNVAPPVNEQLYDAPAQHRSASPEAIAQNVPILPAQHEPDAPIPPPIASARGYGGRSTSQTGCISNRYLSRDPQAQVHAPVPTESQYIYQQYESQQQPRPRPQRGFQQPTRTPYRTSNSGVPGYSHPGQQHGYYEERNVAGPQYTEYGAGPFRDSYTGGSLRSSYAGGGGPIASGTSPQRNRVVSVRDAPQYIDPAPAPIRHRERIRRQSIANNTANSVQRTTRVVRPSASYRTFYGPGPENDYPSEVVYKCFDNENGLLFRLVNNRYHTWAFYNDTADMNMHISVTFGRESRVQETGLAEMIDFDEDYGSCTIQLVVGPGATEPFMHGEYNGYRAIYEAVPLMSDGEEYEDEEDYDYGEY